MPWAPYRLLKDVKLPIFHAKFLIKENTTNYFHSTIDRKLVLWYDFSIVESKLSASDAQKFTDTVAKDNAYCLSEFSDQYIKTNEVENMFGVKPAIFILNNVSKHDKQAQYLKIAAAKISSTFKVDLLQHKYNFNKANDLLSSLVHRGLTLETDILDFYRTSKNSRIGPSGAENRLKVLSLK